MLRSMLAGAFRLTAARSTFSVVGSTILPQRACFATLTKSTILSKTSLPTLCLSPLQTPYPCAVSAVPQQLQPTRALTKFSLVKGKRKSVRAVTKRFKRLDWGIWIRTHCGRHKKLFKKSPALKRRLRQHVFVNASQSWLLDKMVTKFWRRPKYYVDDPYEPYHRRDEFFTTKRPQFKV